MAKRYQARQATMADVADWCRSVRDDHGVTVTYDVIPELREGGLAAFDCYIQARIVDGWNRPEKPPTVYIPYPSTHARTVEQAMIRAALQLDHMLGLEKLQEFARAAAAKERYPRR